jgi:Tol biopolymer transport system component
MNDTSATLRLAVKTDRDLKLSIRIFYSIRDRVLQSLKLKVNGQTLLLTHQIGVTAPVIFTTIIPKTILAASPGLVQLEFDVQETVLAGSGDTRKLGVAFDWVMLEPIVAITPTPNSVSVILPGRIVFTSERNTNPEIFYMNPSQPSIPQRLTYNPAIDSHPALSQDGQWVAFNSNRDGNFKIYTMPINSLFQTMVTDNTDTNANPSWSPDGKQIAYNSTKSILSQIYVVDIGQKSSRLVSSSHNASDFNPAWSPKGNLIAIESNRSFSRDIYSICLNGLCLKNIVANTAFDGDPAWSPDGKQIAFTTNRDGNYEIYVVDASGANARRLTANPSRDEQPTWSPDGQYIAFVSDRSGNKDIWVMKAKDGSIVTNLTADSKADDYDPDWGVEPSK